MVLWSLCILARNTHPSVVTGVLHLTHARNYRLAHAIEADPFSLSPLYMAVYTMQTVVAQEGAGGLLVRSRTLLPVTERTDDILTQPEVMRYARVCRVSSLRDSPVAAITPFWSCRRHASCEKMECCLRGPA